MKNQNKKLAKPRQTAIVASGICKGYTNGQQLTPVLQGVGLTIYSGEIVFLVGPSGSGKTTLLSILGCILTPDQGRLQILGKDVSGLSSDELTAFRRDNLGFIFQSFHLFPTLSALDNLCLALTMRGAKLGPARKQSTELLREVGLGHRLHLRPGQLSTGECQRVAIARSLANEPKILLADEPTASLDAENGQLAMQILSHVVRTRGMTMIVVTHDSRIFSFSDRILHLENGRLKRESHHSHDSFDVSNSGNAARMQLAGGINS